MSILVMQLKMEKPVEAVMQHSSTTFSQVIFNDIPYSYPPSKTITCHYTPTTAFQQNSRDWIGIFKVGWSTTKDYHTFVWVEKSLDSVGKEPYRKQVVFEEYYLPRDDVEFYQFCYIDSTGQVRGASTPFCFKTNGEVSVDFSLDNDCLVITTQEQAEQSAREKEELLKELGQIKDQEKATQRALTAQLEEVEHLKQDNMQMAREKDELVRDLNHFREQTETLKSTITELQQETKRFQETNQDLGQKLSQLNLEQQKAREHQILAQGTQSREESLKGNEPQNPILRKYEKAVIKINLLKQDREELTEKVELQLVDIAQQSTRLRESQLEIQKLMDLIQLLEVDLHSGEKETKRLNEEVPLLANQLEELKRENTELLLTLSEQAPEKDTAYEDLKVQYQTVVLQLNDLRGQLQKEIQVSKVSQHRAESSEKELQECTETMKKIVNESDQTKLKNGKIEMQVTELQIAIEKQNADIQKYIRIVEDKENMLDITKGEKEELSRQLKDLKRDIEKLSREMAAIQLAPPTNSLHHPRPNGTCTHPRDSLEQPLNPSHMYEIIDSVHPYESIESVSNPVGEVLECRHCKENFPGITQDELEIHEQSHRVCPFCTLICDTMEQAEFEDHVYGHEV